MDKISHIKTNMRITAWADMIRKRNESGQTISEWCTNNGINLKTFYYRQRKVREYICEHGTNDNYDTGSLSVKKDLADVLPSVRSFNMYIYFPENRFVITLYSKTV